MYPRTGGADVDKRILGGAAAMGAATIVAGGLYLAMPAAATPAGARTAAQSGASGGDEAGGAQDERQGRLGRHGNKLRRMARFGGLHGETTVRRKDGFVRVAFQRGLVTEASAGAVTIRSLDGTTQRWTTTGDTRVRRHGEKSAAGKVAKGDFAFVIGLADGHKVRLLLVPERVPPKATQAPSPR
jgi:hypothetical protein